MKTIGAVIVALLASILASITLTHAQSASTPPGGCDWISLPQRTADEQDILIGVRGECPTIEIRSYQSLSIHQMSSIYVCQPMTNPRESWCRLPAQTLGRPAEVRIHPEDPTQFVDVWVAEPIAPPPPTPTPPVVEPAEGGAYLKWRIPQDPVVRWFEFEYTAVDTSLTGSTEPVWMPLDQPSAWTYCTSVTATGGRLWFLCKRDVPYKGNRYRVRACNYSGPNATAGCSNWIEEAFLTCMNAPGSSGCPCLVYPSPPSPPCVP